jgi:hypothetical protein
MITHGGPVIAIDVAELKNYLASKNVTPEENVVVSIEYNPKRIKVP